MLKRVASIFRALIGKLVLSLKRFPETLVLCASAVIIMIYMNHIDYNRETEKLLMRICMVLALGVPVSLCVKMLFEKVSLKKTAKTLIYMAAAWGLVLYRLFLLEDVNTVSMIRYIAVSIAFYLTFSFLPYFSKKEGYELYVITLFSRFFVTYLYTLVLYAGIAAILFTINQLFQVRIPSRLYFDCFLVAAGIFGPAFFLADIPKVGEVLHVEDYSKVLKVLLVYIVMPILSIYTLILYAFFAKILFTMEWPKGIVSHLVLWYSIISLIVIFLVYPLRDENRWVKFFTSFLPKIIIPLLVMMFVAMGTRIKAYGITENRYLVLVVGLWVLCCMIYHIIVKKVRNIVLSISLALIAILVVTGPWSCFSISRYSQSMRLENILKHYNMVKNGEITPSDKVADKDKENISSILRYFNNNHSLSDIKYLPDDFAINKMKDVFGFEAYSGGRMGEYFNHSVKGEGILIDVKDYDYFFDVSYNNSLSLQTPDKYDISYTRYNNEIKISREGKVVYSKDISDIAKDIHEANLGKDRLGIDEMTFNDSSEEFDVLYSFKNISGRKDESNGTTIEWMELYVFVKKARG